MATLIAANMKPPLPKIIKNIASPVPLALVQMAHGIQLKANLLSLTSVPLGTDVFFFSTLLFLGIIMPQIILEYTANIQQEINFQHFFHDLHQLLAAQSDIKIEACKSRAVKH